jgi:hypothetical protein
MIKPLKINKSFSLGLPKTTIAGNKDGDSQKSNVALKAPMNYDRLLDYDGQTESACLY